MTDPLSCREAYGTGVLRTSLESARPAKAVLGRFAYGSPAIEPLGYSVDTEVVSGSLSTDNGLGAWICAVAGVPDIAG